MNTKEFLKSSDENILKFEVLDTKDAKGNMEVAAFILIGDSKKSEKKYLESLTKKQIEKPSIRFQKFEIMLTKAQLKFMLSEIEKEEGIIED